MTLRRVLRTLPWETDMDLIRAFSFGVLIGLGILGVVVVVTLSSPRIENPTTSPQPAAVSQSPPNVSEPVIASGTDTRPASISAPATSGETDQKVEAGRQKQRQHRRKRASRVISSEVAK